MYEYRPSVIATTLLVPVELYEYCPESRLGRVPTSVLLPRARRGRELMIAWLPLVSKSR